MPDLNALALFARVVEAGSLSEAGRRLGMPLSSVSRRISGLEDQLGVRLLERSTRNFRLTDTGSEVFEHALRSRALAEAVDDLVSHQRTTISGLVRLSAPPSISETLITPLVRMFQDAHPEVRMRILVTDRYVDHIAEGIDLAFRVGVQKDSTLISRKILSFRHQLVASPSYLDGKPPPRTPQDLLGHRLVAFLHSGPGQSWTFRHVDGRGQEDVRFNPALAMNDYSGLAAILVDGAGIGALPPLVQPHLLRDGILVEVLRDWRFRRHDLCAVHLGGRHMSRPLRAFIDLAAQMAPALFPRLPD